MLTLRSDMQQIRREIFDGDGVCISGEKIILRRILPTDREDYIDIYRAKPAWRELFAFPGLNAAEGLWRSFNDPDVLNMVIAQKNGGAFCGFCGLRPYEGDSHEISIELLERFQKQGIGTESLTLMMARFAEATGSRTFISLVTAKNIASQLLMRRLGGIPDGTAPMPGLNDEQRMKMENSDSPQPDNIEAIAAEFGSTPKKLRSHVLVFRFDI